MSSIGGRFGGLMKLSHPVRACDEAIYFKLFQKFIATNPTIMDTIKGDTMFFNILVHVYGVCFNVVA